MNRHLTSYHQHQLHHHALSNNFSNNAVASVANWCYAQHRPQYSMPEPNSSNISTWYHPTQQQHDTDYIDMLANFAERRMVAQLQSTFNFHPSVTHGTRRMDASAGLNRKESPNQVTMFPSYHKPGDSPHRVQLESANTNVVSCKGHKVGRIRRYNEHTRAYGAWEDIYANSNANNSSIQIHLNRGGKIGIHTNMLPDDKRQSLSKAMHQCKLYRQYTRSQVFHEPRFHVLLSSKAAHCNTGYMYHGIRMKAEPIELVPEVSRYADELAKYYNLTDHQWDIGVDMIVYKDGDDSIGWHADDTQGESVVLCVVVDAPGEPRPVNIRPKRSRTKLLTQGDEEIRLYIGESDGYDMDGVMQDEYEHSLPKQKSNAHRFVLLFRHGNEAYVPVDSGTAITELAERSAQTNNKEGPALLPLLSRLRVKLPSVNFGHNSNIVEGSCYSRRYLYSTHAHRSDQRGINGNISVGCDSIVVSRQSPECREKDGLLWLRYTSNRRQGGGALSLSFTERYPIRVFRSSNLTSEYAPRKLDTGQTAYRYDGLYMISNVWSAAGRRMTADSILDIPVGGDQYTFHLERLPKVETSVYIRDETHRNSIDIDELWNSIQLSRIGCQQRTPFAQPHSKYSNTLPRIMNDALAPD